jgi:hypothetical protein
MIEVRGAKVPLPGEEDLNGIYRNVQAAVFEFHMMIQP